MSILEQLGISAEDAQERLIEKCASNLLKTFNVDENGQDYEAHSPLKRELEKRLKKAVDAKLDSLFAAHVLPNVVSMVENLTLTKTNGWGEKKGEPMTFVEYLVSRADFYLREQVDYQGKGKGETDAYSWSAKGTRVSYIIDKHLQYSIETAMKTAMKSANESIIGGIEAAVKMKLGEVADKLKVSVSAK